MFSSILSYFDHLNIPTVLFFDCTQWSSLLVEPGFFPKTSLVSLSNVSKDTSFSTEEPKTHETFDSLLTPCHPHAATKSLEGCFHETTKTHMGPIRIVSNPTD